MGGPTNTNGALGSTKDYFELREDETHENQQQTREDDKHENQQLNQLFIRLLKLR